MDLKTAYYLGFLFTILLSGSEAGNTGYWNDLRSPKPFYKKTTTPYDYFHHKTTLKPKPTLKEDPIMKPEGKELGNPSVSECQDHHRQSPIDLPKKGIEASFEPLYYGAYNQAPSKYYLVNNGHTVKITSFNGSSSSSSNTQPFIHGGGLGSTYRFAQFHFHWGNTSDSGSEHLIERQAFPLELHLVHYNTKYGDSLPEALKRSNGSFDALAVLSVLYELRNEGSSSTLGRVAGALKSVGETHSEFEMKGFPLRSLLPADDQSYYRYSGSLTTPPCNQIVLWTIFKERVGVSEEQLEKFRLLHGGPSTPAHLVDTYRDLQSVNGRLVYEVSAGGNKKKTPLHQDSTIGKLGMLAQLMPKGSSIFNNASFNFYLTN